MSCINVAYDGSAKLIIPKFKDVEIYVQNFALPGVHTNNPEIQGPQARMPMGTTGIIYDVLRVQFLIGENFSGYMSIIKWLQAAPTTKHSELFSDATISLLTTAKRPFQDIVFRDVIPVSCEMSKPFDITRPEPSPLTATAVFDYTNFYFVE